MLRVPVAAPMGLEAGTARLVGTDSAVIEASITELLSDRGAYDDMANAVSPYGDGRAAQRIADHLEHFFGFRAQPAEEFVYRPGSNQPEAS